MTENRPRSPAGTQNVVMASYHADRVDLTADTEYGDGWITFRWPDRLFGWECLEIALDGHCSRRMPVHSGDGLPEFVELKRDRIRFRFEPALAEKLELEEDVEISFDISDDDFRQLCKAINYFDPTVVRNAD
jgi:hypothetical protein